MKVLSVLLSIVTITSTQQQGMYAYTALNFLIKNVYRMFEWTTSNYF